MFLLKKGNLMKKIDIIMMTMMIKIMIKIKRKESLDLDLIVDRLVKKKTILKIYSIFYFDIDFIKRDRYNK